MSWLGYRQATLCRIHWLSPGSPAAKTLFPIPTIQKLDDGSFTFTYYARSRDIHTLLSAMPQTGSRKLEINRQSIVCETPDLVAAQACLAALQSADKPAPGSFVIRGKLVDPSGKPVARATIDL